MRVLGRGWRCGDPNPCFCPHRYVHALSEGFCPAPWTDGHGYAAGHSAVASGVGFGRVLAVACVTYVWEPHSPCKLWGPVLFLVLAAVAANTRTGPLWSGRTFRDTETFKT